MKRFLILSLLTLLVISCDKTPESAISIAENTFPHDFMYMQRAYPSGEINATAYREAIAWKKQRAQRNAGSAVWEFSGPVNIGGRITDIEIPVNDAQTYYVGAASGGIFKTTDAGASWNPIFDDQQMLSIGDIELSRTNPDLVWVGTGEPNGGGGSLAFDGDGVYKSEDGGITWESKGLSDVGSIGKVLIDPNDDQTIFVGAMGPLFRDDSNRGVYRSTDGGDNWEQVLFVSDITGVIDMSIHPTNSDIVYAATWERIRRPDNRIYGGATSGLHRSTDGGTTWVEMTNGLPTAPNEKGRISIDISRSNPDVLYARYTDAFGSIQGVYRTADGGNSWTAVNSGQLTNVGFHWWFRGIFIDPSDENTIYNVDFVVQKSTDGGQNWFDAFSGVHVDQHALAFNETTSGEVLLGNDGGFYKSSDDGASFTKDLTLPITQFYRFHVDSQNGDKIYGGTQDNSTMRTTTGGLSDWQIITGGDGFQPLVDPSNTNVIYALSQRGNLVKSTDDAANFSSALNGIDGADRNNWDTPIAIDPQNSQTIYYGTQRLYQSTNAANNWTAISPDLTQGSGSGNLTFGTITSISISPFNSDVIYTGADDGTISVTTDGGSNWNTISNSLPTRWVTSVYASPDDANTVYATFSGYRFGEDSGNVFVSNDNGSNWTDIGSGLPDIPLSDVLKDSFGNLYVASDVGVFGTTDEGTNWEVIGANLPAVVVTDMHLDEANDLLYVGTYGRSSYKLDLSSDILATDDIIDGNTIRMAPNPASEIVRLSLPTSERIELTIFDALGRKMSSTIVEGGSHELSVSQLSNGIYYLQFDGGKTKLTKKLIVN